MLLIAGTIRLPADALDRARWAMATMIAASRAEPGCLAYSYAQDVIDAGVIHIAERWTDRAALDAHFASVHIAEWRKTWLELGITDRDLTLYEVGEGTAI